ncbi:MAG: hypothetical protein RMH77_03860 [Sulfolobales archaeon]|nr:hypothetical protein [Sulfolobales archaeon]MCX8185583.1 hypothetical protein [Sulfolobales archaeon]MDW7969526.1 hypothetical protein [Sulfolobales archaeon]
MLPGHKGYIKTSVIYVTYNDAVSNEILNTLSLKYKVLSFARSKVVKELYYVEVEGNVKEDMEEFLRNRTIWYKVDVLEFK